MKEGLDGIIKLFHQTMIMLYFIHSSVYFPCQNYAKVIYTLIINILPIHPQTPSV